MLVSSVYMNSGMDAVVYKWMWLNSIENDNDSEDSPDIRSYSGLLSISEYYYKSRDICVREALQNKPGPGTIPYLMIELYPYTVANSAYKSVSERWTSFQDWGKHMKPTRFELAEAGFYYLGNGDRVRCFCCGVTLRNWEQFDNAWAEHEKYAHNCMFLHLR